MLEDCMGRRTYVLHEFLANGTDFLGEGGGEHHDMLVFRCRPKNILDIPSHVYVTLALNSR
jgi:hypothetical protein